MNKLVHHSQVTLATLVFLLAGPFTSLHAQIAPPPDPDLTIVTIEGPKEGSLGASFALGDGILWAYANDTLYRIAPQDDHLTTIAAERLKGRVVQGFAFAAGSIWIIKFNTPGVHRMDPNSGKFVDTILSDKKHLGRLTYQHESLWVWEWSHAIPTLLRIDPKGGQMVEIEPGKGYWIGPVFAEDAAWIMEQEKGIIKKIDLQSNKIVDEFSAGKAQQNSMLKAQFVGGSYSFTAGAGSLWVADRKFNNGKYLLSRIDPKTHERIAKIEIDDSQGAPVFWNGFLWTSTYGDHLTGHSLTKINPKTNHVANQVFLPAAQGGFLCRGSMPPGLLADDNSLWAFSPGTCAAAHITISRIQQKSEGDR